MMILIPLEVFQELLDFHLIILLPISLKIKNNSEEFCDLYIIYLYFYIILRYKHNIEIIFLIIFNMESLNYDCLNFINDKKIKKILN
jgi:hypothetical protein